MDLPFSLKFHIGTKENTYVEEVLFSRDESFFMDFNPFKVKEFSELSFVFNSSNEKVKLYIPELDDYLIETQLEDEYGGSYYEPTNKEVIIFNYQQGKTIPLIPGYYFLFVETETETFYSQFEVIPKDLEQSNWVKMRDEIENIVGGLAVDFISKKNSQRKIIDADLFQQNYIFQRIQNMIKDIPQAIISLESLKKEAKYKITKHYSWNPIGSKNLVDQKTIWQLQIHPEKRGLLYTPNRIIVYDVIENQWVKLILMHFKRFSLLADEYLENVIQSVMEEKNNSDAFNYRRSESEKIYNTQSYETRIESLKRNQNQIKHFQAYILEFLHSSVMKNVTSKRPNHVPKSLVLNPKYNSIYKMYLNNIRNTINLNFSPSYQYYWKRTDVLYEIWCYTKVIKSILALDFIPISGWIFENNSLSQELPFLRDGTNVVFKKADIKINLVFNESMKKESFTNTLEVPVKTSSVRNKPDIRLDIIVDERNYIGSLIFEVKYKKLVNILYKDDRKQRQQLMSYKQNTMSGILAFPEVLMRSLQTVAAVIALYPSDEKGNMVPKYFANEGIYFCLLNPSFDETELSDKIDKNLKERIDLFKSFGRRNEN
ncbi:nuclease domain-containing protein [Isobaculum melis]|uniref:PD-(D/E)XK nuclease superfamily protein n=1 Tax=Isobaculum melis TaxID=142588 RepID=A0A1H9PQJ0_9LACT|nr:nuclease domain-containing protein [Isobaculum melis]SER50398.1 PD-(D/E)XK nuclease superfamily protein [Isobaculum melis]